MNIYVCGGSAVGKTTFCHELSKAVDIPVSEEIIRQGQEWFSRFSLLHRETYFLLGQLFKERQAGDYVFDRSILDVVCWMIDGHDDDLYKFVNEHYVDTEGFYIITPPEDSRYVSEHIDDYMNDPIRVQALSDKLGFNIKEEQDMFIKLYPEFARWERESMLKMLLGKNKPRFSYASMNSADLYDYKWQKEVLRYIWQAMC